MEESVSRWVVTEETNLGVNMALLNEMSWSVQLSTYKTFKQLSIPVSVVGFQTYLQELESTWIGISSRQLYSLEYYEKGEGKQEIITPVSALKHFCGQNC